jgi:UDP-N-acetyl-2-amino-2-deoxyglucuronate dehydrogenase
MWFLSLDKEDLPDKSLSVYRRMIIDGNRFEFDSVFSELHTESYREIFNGNGFGIDESFEAIQLVSSMRRLM